MVKPKYPGRGMSFVTCRLERRAAAVESDEPEYEIRLTDETEMTRSFFGMTWREVIDHSPKSIRMDRLNAGRAAFLYEHDPRDQIGVLYEPRVEGRALYAKVRWASHQHAKDVRQMVDDDVRPNISVGMVQHRVKLVEKDDEKGDLWRVLEWEPMEASSVAIGNNENAAFVRDSYNGADSPQVEVDEATPPQREAKHMKYVRTDSGGVLEVADDDPREALSDGQVAQYHTAEIVRLCEKHNVSGMAAHYIESGLSVDQVARQILNGKATPGKPVTPAVADPLKALGKRERRSYSYSKALMQGLEKLDGLERDVHQELVANQKALGLYGRADRGSGVMLPLDLRTDDDRMQSYTLSSQVATKGAETVFDRPGEIIELLRNQSAVLRLGARFLPGLTGPVAFSKQTGAMTATWVGENPASAVTATDLALGLVTLSPHWLQATTTVSRQLLLQASVDVEAMIRADLAAIHALAIDRAAIHGLGAGGEPRGIYTWPDVQQQAMGGAVDYIELTTMVGKVADKNALMGAAGWLTTPLMAAKWLATLDFAAASAGLAIWQGRIDTPGPGGRVAGYPAFSSNQVSKTMTGTAGATTGGSDHGILFGNWGDQIVGMFGALEVVVDPYTLADKGLIKMTSFQGADVIIRHGESFCVSTGATTA